MELPVRDQLKYWGIAALIFLLVMWWLGGVILPFLLGAAVAYFLDPVADRLEALGLSRAMATAIITVLALICFVALLLVVIPTLINQTTALVEAMPQIADRFQAFLTERFPSVIDNESTIRRSLGSLGTSLQERGGQVLSTVVASVGSIVNVAVLFVIVPVVAFYLLLDWDRMVAKIDALLPREHAPVIRQLAHEIDDTLAGFVRGQGTVCLILGTYYAVALMLVGLPFGLVVGFIAGALTFIPYVGALVGGALAIGLALFQFWGAAGGGTDWLSIGLVAAIFVSGQFLEGNILTPKLVGGSVGLHPVWLLFALSAFGSIYGFVGMLVAVPVAAALGVMARFLVAEYRDSVLYTGRENAIDTLDRPRPAPPSRDAAE